MTDGSDINRKTKKNNQQEIIAEKMQTVKIQRESHIR